MNQSEDNNQSGFKSALTITVVGVAVITIVVIFIALLLLIHLSRSQRFQVNRTPNMEIGHKR